MPNHDSELHCRSAVSDDLVAILGLYSQLNPDDPVVDLDAAQSLIAEIVADERLQLFVGVIEQRVVATCYLNIVPNLSRGLSPYGIIENVVVEYRVRNSGYGQNILAYALASAWQHDCYKVMLQTGSRQASTHQFYRSCGFSGDTKFAFVAKPE